MISTLEINPAFFSAVILTLVLILGVAIVSMILQRRGIDSRRKTLFWSKLILSAPVLALAFVVAHFVTAVFGTMLLIGGGDIDPTLLLLTLAPMLLLATLMWIFVR